MADDWVKMRTDLYRDPKVCMIADLIHDPDSLLSRYINQVRQCDSNVTRNVMRNATVGALVSVWGVCRHRGKRYGDDLVLKNSTLEVIDDIADIPGFGQAMNQVGWIIKNEKGLVFPGFFEDWNVDPYEESRKRNAERQRKFREKAKSESNVTVTLRRNKKVTLEKSREEKEESSNTPLIPLEEVVTKETLNDKICSTLGATWTFHLKRTKNRVKADDPDDAQAILESLKPFGYTEDEIAAAITDKARDKTEHLWEFKKRMLAAKQGKADAKANGVTLEEELKKYNVVWK